MTDRTKSDQPMSNQLPTGCAPGAVVLCVVTVATVAVVVIGAAAFGMTTYYGALRHGIDHSAPGFLDYTNEIYCSVWLLVAPLAILNLFWVFYALSRWVRPIAVSIPPAEPPDIPPEARQHFMTREAVGVQRKAPR